ncbi:MAG: DUF454 domain-containing protein [Nitrospirae bacterium]|nr:DUF454 domain-containing protein [Candidatus Manganitrophaceae bacterium]
MHDQEVRAGLSPSTQVIKNEPKPSGHLLRRRCFIAAGFVSITMGILGIVLPILPTTPFMLLGAYCFSRGSQKWHDWLLNHHIFGGYILAFRDRRGLTRQQKYRIALSVSVMMSISVFLVRGSGVSVLISLIWVLCLSVLFLSPTSKKTLDLKSPSKTFGGTL